MITSFRDLKMWQMAALLAEETYRATALLPEHEIYGLRSQMRRAAVSIASNIAEGSKRKTRKDFLQFLHIESGSCAELETQLYLTTRIYPSVGVAKASEQLNEIQKMLSAYIRKMYST